MNIKFIEGLQKRKNRRETGYFFLEGFRSVTEAISGGAFIVKLVASESFVNSSQWKQLESIYGSAYHKNAELVLLRTGDKSFARLSDTVTPQGIGAVIEIPWRELCSPEAVLSLPAKDRFGILILENLQDPGNMGTIIRTADAAGFRAVICSEGTVDIYNSKVLRSTVGSLFRFPVLQTELTGPEIAACLKREGYCVAAAHPRGGVSLFEADFPRRTAICIGNEAGGLSEQLLAGCDRTVTIPMPGGTESLNASVAAALMMYEVRRMCILPNKEEQL